MQAGKYNESFTLLGQSSTKSTTGQDEDTFESVSSSSSASVVVLWGEMTPIDGTESTDYGAVRAQSSVQIIFRQYPSMKAQDRLEHRATGDLYVIDGIYRDRAKNTTVVNAHEYQQTILEDQ